MTVPEGYRDAQILAVPDCPVRLRNVAVADCRRALTAPSGIANLYSIKQSDPGGWMALTHCSECNAQMSDKAGACPSCGAPNPAIPPKVPPQAAVAAQQAKLETKFESAGVGCLWQTVGICVVWIFPIGTIIGLALFVYGSSKARYFRCGACKNRLSDKGVTLCPSCGANLK